MLRWYVAETQPRAEAKAVWHLQRQGFTTYLPQYRKLRRHARRTDEVRVPLFPRYLFVSIDMALQAWRAIHSTVGVTRLITHGDTPAAVPEGIVEDIRAREDESGLVLLPPPFRPGELVRVLAGSFADQIGIYECASDAHRVVLLLDLLGRKVRLKLPLSSVAAAA